MEIFCVARLARPNSFAVFGLIRTKLGFGWLWSGPIENWQVHRPQYPLYYTDRVLEWQGHYYGFEEGDLEQFYEG